jgi:iron complex transport system permease protein
MIRKPAMPLVLSVLLGVSLLLLVIGSSAGSSGWSNPLRVWQQSGSEGGAIDWQIIWDIRLPRSVGAWLAGALLGFAGALAQGLFRNPLADPFLLGSASGASLGVSCALAFMGVNPLTMAWFSRLGLTGAAFIGALLAALLTLALARGVAHTLRLLLAGVIVGVVLGALSSLITLISPEIVQAMQAFMLGSTAYVGWSACAIMASVLLICLSIAAALARVLDALGLGENTAASLGLPLLPARMALIALVALATAAAVAHTGLVAFVGLAAPHLVRALLHVRHRAGMVLSAITGGALLCAADLCARTWIAPAELPVGVLTALLGGGYLLWLMHRGHALQLRD